MFRFYKKCNYNAYSLIMPSVSVGNVGQLTIDLIISTYNLTKIGTVWHKAIIPAYGPNPFDNSSDDNCLACELYGSEKYNIVVLQLRSSIEPRMMNAFLEDLKSCIIKENFKEVIILTSSFFYELHDINSGHFKYVSNSAYKDILESNQVLPMNLLEIQGGKFAIKLYQTLEGSVDVLILVKYVSEGDNRPDAISMLNLLNVCLKLEKSIDVKFPLSWSLVYGNPAPSGIY